MTDTHVSVNSRSLRSIVEGKKKEPRRAEALAPTNPIGFLSRTIIQSPTVNWVLPGRIRDGSKNYILFVGDDFVHIKEVVAGGHLQHVSTKGGFESTIRAAKILGESVKIKAEPNATTLDDGVSIKAESSAGNDTTSQSPQILILAMESNELIFMFANHITNSSSDQLEFHTCSLPLVKEVSLLEQPGEHLAVDPYSRAVAVGAYQSNIHLYRTKPIEEMIENFYNTSRDQKKWSPFTDERVINVEGVILKMDFLYPEKDDRDHVILLVLYRRFDEKRIFRKILEWNTNEKLTELKNNVGHALTEQQRNIAPSLLIPLKQRSSFLLVYDDDISQFASPLAGGIASQTFPTFLKVTERERPQYPGVSPGKPVWTSWARPKRNDTWSKNNDAVYVAREDGVVMYLEAPYQGVGIKPTWAGRLDGHLGTAFAYYSARDQTRDPRFWASDFLIACGSMSNGQIIKIGDYQPPGTNAVAPVDRITTMNFQFLETVPNWCPTMDISVTPTLLGNGSLQKRSKVYTTSGRQPFGSVAELRSGHEALISLRFEFPDLAGATGLFTFRDTAGNMLFLVTFPSETTLLRLDPFSEEVESVESDECGLDFDNPTLVIASLGLKILQITESCVAFYDQLDRELWLRQTTKIEMPPGSRILRADLSSHRMIAIAVHDGTSAYVQLITVHNSEAGLQLVTTGDRVQFAQVPSSVLLFEYNTCVYLFMGAGDGSFQVCKTDHTRGLGQVRSYQMDVPSSQAGPAVAESITVLTVNSGTDQGKQLLVCGLRNGSLYVAEFTSDVEFTLELSITIPFGHTSVTVLPSSDTPGSTAIVYSGSDVCHIRYSGSIASLEIYSIWITDRDRPWIIHPSISRLCKPFHPWTEDYSSIFTAWTCIAGDDIILMHVSKDGKTVPRQLPVTGTPSRLLHCRESNVMVVGSAYTEADKDGGSRSIRPRLQFLQLENAEYRIPTPEEPSDFLLPTGEKIHSMADWLVTSPDGRKHVLLLVATSWMDGGLKGRLLILRLVTNEEGVMAKKVKNIDGFKSPCTAVAVLDETKVVLAAGEDLYLYEFSLQGRQARRRHKYELGSFTSYITVSEGLIYLSTAQNSLMVLRVVDDEEGNPELRPHFTEGQARKSLHHLTLDLSASTFQGQEGDSTSQPFHPSPVQKLILASDKDGSIVGLLQPSIRTNQLAARRMFEAALPRSITRLKRATIRPPWRQHSIPGVLVNDIIGTASDGALYGFSIVDEKAWRLLKFLENIIKWSKEMDLRRIAHSKEAQIIIDPDMVPADISRRLYHINGDTLQMLLGRSGEARLRNMLAQDSLPMPYSGEPDPAMGPDERLETLKRLMKEVLGDQVVSRGDVLSQTCEWLQGVLGPVL